MFILIRSETFNQLGNFEEGLTLDEDWELTHKIDRKKFALADSYINITNRRFVSQGYLKTCYQYLMIATSPKYRHKNHQDYFDIKFKQ